MISWFEGAVGKSRFFPTNALIFSASEEINYKISGINTSHYPLTLMFLTLYDQFCREV